MLAGRFGEGLTIPPWCELEEGVWNCRETCCCCGVWNTLDVASLGICP